MNPLRRLLQKGISVFTDAWYGLNGFYGISRKLEGGYGRSTSGENVTLYSAMAHSVVWACVRIISESVAFLPLNLMIQNRNGDKDFAPDHPMYRALKNAPNAEMAAMTFRETATGHTVMHGNSFAQISRRSGTGVAYELWPLTPESVTIDREKESQRRLVYLVKDGNSAEKTYTVDKRKPQDILHIPGLGYDGMRGYSVLQMARNSIGNAQAVEKYAGKFFASGGRPMGNIEMANKFKDKEDMAKFKADLRISAQNPETAHEWNVFEPGQKFVPAGFSPEQSQFLETRQWTTPEICRWFLIQPHMVMDLSRATFSNEENLSLQFGTYTLTAWLTRWEQNLWRCVLTPEEQTQGYFFKHNMNGLMRGDFASRMAGYASALQNGEINIDEARDLEDRNALPNGLGKDFRVQLNMQVVGQPPPVLTAAQKQLVMADQIERLIATLGQMQLKETLQ